MFIKKQFQNFWDNPMKKLVAESFFNKDIGFSPVI